MSQSDQADIKDQGEVVYRGTCTGLRHSKIKRACIHIRLHSISSRKTGTFSCKLIDNGGLELHKINMICRQSWRKQEGGGVHTLKLLVPPGRPLASR